MDSENLKISVMPTERDFSLLKSLYENVVMSFPQIARMHFTDRSKPTIINRLTKLESAGLIQRLKVPRLQITNAKKVISVVFQITRIGILVLQKRESGFELKPEPVRLRPYSVDHDLLLVDVIAAFKNKKPGCKIIHGELYLEGVSHQGLKPDAVIVLPNDQGRVALELELTAKSEKRYRDLMLKYRLSKDFVKIIYVTSQGQIENKIKFVLGQNFGGDRFQFLKLTDVLRAANNISPHPSDAREEPEI